MWRLLALSVVQCGMLSFGQLTLKLALGKMLPFGWNREFWWNLLTNWWFLLCGILFGGGSLLWMYILRNYPLSMAMPMGSLSYVFTILLAIFCLHEPVSITRWIGVLMIMVGCVFVSQN